MDRDEGLDRRHRPGLGRRRRLADARRAGAVDFVPALLSAVFYLAVVGQALLVDPEKDVEVVR